MKKFLLFALLVVTVMTAAVTLGGYDKSPPGFSTEISAIVNQVSNLASAEVIVIHNDIAYRQSAENPAVRVEFIIEESTSVRPGASLSYESWRWRQDNAVINKTNRQEAKDTNPGVLYRPKLC